MQADAACGSVWPGHPDYVPMRGALDLKHDRWVLDQKTGKKSHVHEQYSI